MIEELKRFIAVSKNKHITKTAQELFITQSALSQSIQRLERELKTKLIIYRAKQFTITPEGETVVVLGTKIVELWETMHDKQIQRSAKQKFSIGLFDNAALLLGNFFQKDVIAANMKIELTIESSSQLMNKLQLGVLDIALCVLHPEKNLDEYSDIFCIAEFTEELIPVSGKLFSHKLSKIPFILYNKDSHTRKQMDSVFSKISVYPTLVIASTSTTYMKEIAKSGSGIAFLPYNFVSDEIKQKQLFKQKIPIKMYRTFGVFIKKNALDQERKLSEIITTQIEKKLEILLMTYPYKI